MVDQTREPPLDASSSTAETAFPNGEFASALRGDDELIALCQAFRQTHAQWDECIRTTATTNYDEPSGGAALLELRIRWGEYLAGIQESRPQTLRGALAKLEIACVWSEWSGQADGSALKFLAEASREWQSLLSDQQVSAEASFRAARADRRGRSSWLANWRRLPWRGPRLEVDTSMGARRSQT
jgi:hypothetical protein